MTITFKRLRAGLYGVLRDGEKVGGIYRYKGPIGIDGFRTYAWGFHLAEFPPPFPLDTLITLEMLEERGQKYPEPVSVRSGLPTYREAKDAARRYLQAHPEVEAIP